MRKVSLLQVFVFLLMASVAAATGVGGTHLLLTGIPLGQFTGVVYVLAGVVIVYAACFLVFRIFLALFPLRSGEIGVGSSQEFIYHVYLLWNLLAFYPLTRSGLLPVPLMRLVYQALGARLGPNTYSSGIIFDPQFVDIGGNTIVGQSALLVPHAIDGLRIAHDRIRIGDGVTIGAMAVICSGTTIGDGAIVAMGAVVPKGSNIGAGEVWGGVPARKLRDGRRED